MSSLHSTNEKIEAQRAELEIGILVHMIYCRNVLKKGGERKQVRKGEGVGQRCSLSGICFNPTPWELWGLWDYT